MSPTGPDDRAVLLATERSDLVREVEEALSRDGIPYEVGLMPGPPARMVFSVPRRRLRDARRTLEDVLEDPDEEPGRPEDDAPAVFPWGPALVVLAVVTFHLALVLALASPWLDGRAVRAAGAVGPGLALAEPWRLLTSLVLHSGPPHVLWNGVSMLVFSLPLLLEQGHARIWGVYLLSGIGGGLMTAAVSEPGTLAIGSSGAVAGLFAAWVAHRLRHARVELVTRRARIRALGIGLLVLPTLLQPTGAAGQRISVSSHVGGLLVGLLLGLLLSRRRAPAPGVSSRPSRTG